MLKKKISFILVLVLICSLVLTGCNSSGAPEAVEGSEETIVIKFSHNQPIASPEHVGAEKFKEIAETESGGRIKVEIYPALQMGSLREQVEGVQIGTINISMQPSAVISPFVDDIKLCDLPYIWPKDRQKAYEILDGEMGRELLDRLEQGGFHGLGYWFGGYKLLSTKDTEIHKPSDLAGLRMRIMEAPILISQYEAWGATPIALPYAELYNALQQGIVDGQENPLQTIYLNNYHEVQNEIIQSYHGVMMYVLIANKEWFDGLPKDIQEIVIKAEEEGRKVARDVLTQTENEYAEKIKESGVHYYELTDEEIEVFREASKPVHDKHYNTEWQKDYINRLYEVLGY